MTIDVANASLLLENEESIPFLLPGLACCHRSRQAAPGRPRPPHQRTAEDSPPQSALASCY